MYTQVIVKHAYSWFVLFEDYTILYIVGRFPNFISHVNRSKISVISHEINKTVLLRVLDIDH